ncbi:MAG: hypothetical protein ACKOSR_08950, partial [Flavobacteriales bacterium]
MSKNTRGYKSFMVMVMIVLFVRGQFCGVPNDIEFLPPTIRCVRVYVQCLCGGCILCSNIYLPGDAFIT